MTSPSKKLACSLPDLSALPEPQKGNSHSVTDLLAKVLSHQNSSRNSPASASADSMFSKPLPLKKKDSQTKKATFVKRRSTFTMSQPSKPAQSPVGNYTRAAVMAKAIGLTEDFSPRELASIPEKKRESVIKKAKVLISQKKGTSNETRKFPWKPMSLRRLDEINLHLFSQSSDSQISDNSCSSAFGLEFLSNIDGPSTPAVTPSMSPPTQNVLDEAPPSQDGSSAQMIVPETQASSSETSSSHPSTNDVEVVPESQTELFDFNTSLKMAKSSLSRVENEAFLPLPLVSYPTCTEDNCNYTFVADSFINICRAINMHYKKKHGHQDFFTKKFCTLCKKLINELPWQHACLKGSAYFAVKFSEYSFENKCKSCGFSCPTKYWFKRHHCMNGRNPRPVCSNSDSSPETSRKTQASRARQPHQILTAPVSSSNDVTQVQLFPSTFCRVGGNLHFVFPIMQFLSCTEPGCKLKFYSDKWDSSKQSLLRHIRESHDLPGVSPMHWCSRCSSEIKEYHISRHPCFANGDHFQVDFMRTSHKNKCNECDFSHPTRRGLRNHVYRHKRNEGKSKKASSKVPSRSCTPATASQNSDTSSSQHIIGSRDSSTHSSDVLGSSLPVQQDASQIPDSEEIHDLPINETFIHSLDSTDEVVDPDSASPSEEFIKKFRSFFNDENAQWETIRQTIEEYTEFVQSLCKVRIDSSFKGRRLQNPKNPRFIQRLYRRNRRRAVRLIMNDSQPQCELEPTTLAKHFFPDGSLSPDPGIFNVLEKAADPVDLSHFSPEEVWAKLSKSENTAPGPDRLTFFHWKKADPDAKALSSIFNLCIKHQRIPCSWNESRTVFIPKDGGGHAPNNWRPISLCSTVAKLFSGCIAKRLLRWALDFNVLCPAQKGFMPFDGAFENNYVFQYLMNDARLNNREICFASIDITNAFGSIPHSAVTEALKACGAGSKLIKIVSSLLNDACTSIQTSTGTSGPHPIQRGVRQGDPISGLLFNFAIEPILRSLRNPMTKVLAFADDILILAETKTQLQESLDTLHTSCLSLGLELNPTKCFSLHLSNSPRGCVPTLFKLGNEDIPYLLNMDEKPFLGKPIGFQLVSDFSDLDCHLEAGKKILESALAPWQSLNAAKTFFFPSLAYAQRTGQVSKSDWEKLDKEIRPLIKRNLCLPANASNEYLYGNTSSGHLGIPVIADDSDIANIDGAFKLLSSRDPIVKDIAWKDLKRLVSAAMHDCSPENLSNFLSGSNLSSRPSGPKSIWSRARLASSHLQVIWEFNDDSSFSISYGDVTVTDRRKVFQTLRNLMRNSKSEALKNKPHQGKTAHLYSKAKVSSHFNHTGEFIRFTDWNFIHRARLGLVDLNGYKRDVPDEEKKCRRCRNYNETLPHVLNNCNMNLKHITERHDAFVERIKNAAAGRWKILSENQEFHGSKLRPDLIISKGSSVIIIDATFPFENGPDAFEKARKIKIDKYSHLAKSLRTKYKDVSIAPLIIGSLGSWDPCNDKVLLRLCSRKYLKLMKKLAVSDTVRYSRDIFVEHTSGKKQVQPMRYRRRIPSLTHRSSDTDVVTNVDVTVLHNSEERTVNVTQSTISPNIEISIDENSSTRNISFTKKSLNKNRIANRSGRNSHVVVADVHALRELDTISSAPSPPNSGEIEHHKLTSASVSAPCSPVKESHLFSKSQLSSVVVIPDKTRRET